MKKPAQQPQQEDSTLADLELEPLLQRLETSAQGLSQEEAERRLDRYGPNELEEEKVSRLRLFLGYFWGPIPWMIEVAAVLSAFVRHWADFVIILVLLLLNALVAFWEEFQANNTVAALKAKLALNARVRRGGKWREIPARELVPGDVILLHIGKVVPADAKLLAGDPVEVDQSALTGESLPVGRGPGEKVFSGSVVKQGEAEAVVFATGSDAYFGKTAKLVGAAHTRSHFQQAVLKIGNRLILAALSLAIVIIGVALARGDSMLTTLRFVLILTVAAVPVAMPAVLSVTMAVGARLLARKKAVVTRLAAIEEMAGVDVLCSDKTGTLTQNELTLGKPFVAEGFSDREVVLAAALASRAEDGDPIDDAVIGGLEDPGVLEPYTAIKFTPFDPVNKRTEALVEGPDQQQFKVTKGAPQVVLDMVADRASVREAVRDTVNRFAKRGYRSLGVARTDEQGDFRFMGVIPLFDPPRPDSKSTIQAAREMGIETKMVTGDQTAIARETSRQLGLGTRIVDVDLFKSDQGEERRDLGEVIEQADGFSQVYPEHKHRIVEVLQDRGHFVGMTGDGVNDAPALKQADAGIAVSGATDAARAAADIVLLEPGLDVVLDAVKESRKSFQRMNYYAVYRIAETARVLLFMTLSIIAFNFYPVTAVMIVLLALLNDGAILSIAYDRAPVAPAPQRWDMRRVLIMSGALGLIGTVASFGLLLLGKSFFGLSAAVIQSLIYLKLSVAGHLTIFVTRTKGPFWSTRPSPILLGAVLLTQLVATLIVVYGLLMPAIGWAWAGVVWGYALVWFLLEDRLKIFVDHLLERRAPEMPHGQPDHVTA